MAKIARIMCTQYWANDEPAIAFVLQFAFLPRIHDWDNEQALRWCKHFIERAERCDFHFPLDCGMSEGMKEEWDFAGKLGIPRKRDPWWNW
jgi:hypothetical protein